MPALVDSQQLISQQLIAKTEAPRQIEVPRQITDSRVVLLENSDFHDLEVQELKSNSFAGAASPVRSASKTPVFVVLDSPGNVELLRLQVGKGTRELAATKDHLASEVPIVMTQLSSTLRKFTVKDPLSSGEYVILLENSDRGFLFSVR